MNITTDDIRLLSSYKEEVTSSPNIISYYLDSVNSNSLKKRINRELLISDILNEEFDISIYDKYDFDSSSLREIKLHSTNVSGRKFIDLNTLWLDLIREIDNKTVSLHKLKLNNNYSDIDRIINRIVYFSNLISSNRLSNSKYSIILGIDIFHRIRTSFDKKIIFKNDSDVNVGKLMDMELIVSPNINNNKCIVVSVDSTMASIRKSYSGVSIINDLENGRYFISVNGEAQNIINSFEIIY